MDNQHQKIKGYRDLSQHEIDLMNEIKAKGAEIEALCNRVETHLDFQRSAALNDQTEKERIAYAQPPRWLAIARTELQTGVMALTRAVAQPTTF